MSDTLGLRCVRHRDETIESTFRFATLDRFRRQCSTDAEIFRLTCDDEGGGGVEYRHIAEWAIFPFENVKQGRRIMFGVPAAQLFRPRPRKSGVFGGNLERPDIAVLKRSYTRWSRRSDFVEPIR